MKLTIIGLFMISMVISPLGAQTTDSNFLTADSAFNVALNARTMRPQDQFALSNKLPLIVFIPGIMGSMLKWKNYTFGQDPINGRQLVLKSDHVPERATLNEFRVAGLPKTFSRLDIYGIGLDALKSANEGRLPEEFSYDWRVSIDDSAAELQKWLSEPTRRGRKVIFVAHSMGGLVLWRWFQLYKPQNRAVTTDHAVFVGSPLQGTCEAARMLINGYRAPTGSHVWEEWITQIMFNDARGALFTFPSVFQLLPAYHSGRACLKLRSPASGTADEQDHHSPDFWIGSAGRAGGMKGGSGAKLVELAESTGLDLATYERSVRQAIEAGRRFRAELSLEPPKDVPMSHLSSDKFPMPSAFVLRLANPGWYAVHSQEAELGGDGRVLQASAQNAGYGGPPMSTRVAISETHGSQMKDPALLKYVKDSVLAGIRAAKIEAVADLVRQHGQTSATLSQYVIDPGISIFTSSEALLAAQRTIAQHNFAVIGPVEKTAPASALKAFGWTTLDAEKQSQNSNMLGASLIESALILEPEAVTADDVRRLAIARQESDEGAKAVAAGYQLSTALGQKQVQLVWKPLIDQGLIEIDKSAVAAVAGSRRPFDQRQWLTRIRPAPVN